MKFYKVLPVPSFIYYSECWTQTSSDRREISTSEMRFLNHVAGHARYDRKSNRQIRKELEVNNIDDKTTHNRQN